MRLLIVTMWLVIVGCIVVAVARALPQKTQLNYSWASWYGPGLYGNPMACGGRLTTSTWGVANKSLRCGTKLRMCYKGCVTVRVIDRGPYVAGRDFDLTYSVKTAIGMPDVGTVRWWIIK